MFATQSPELVAAQRAGRLAHDPAELARMLRACGPGRVAAAVGPAAASSSYPGAASPAGELDEKYVACRRADGRTRCRRGGSRRSPGAGHAPQLEDPDAFAAELLHDFLDEHF